VRALVHVLCRCFAHVSSDEAAHTEPTILDQLGVIRNLSPTRQNGLKAVRERIAWLAQNNP
jgi:cysteine desulfuration protein SufE